MSWGDEEPINEVTVKELSELCSSMKELREEKSGLEKEVKAINTKLTDIQAKILNYLDEYGMKNFSGDFGTVIRSKKYSVRQPGSPEAKEAFYDYLKKQGIFEELISVNSRTLASWVKKEIEAKKEEGIYDFVPPGIDTPETIETISLRKS